MSGTAVRIEGAMFALEQRLQAKRGMPAPQAPGDILADGYEWYKFTPDRFELTYNTRFGSIGRRTSPTHEAFEPRATARLARVLRGQDDGADLARPVLASASVRLLTSSFR